MTIDQTREVPTPLTRFLVWLEKAAVGRKYVYWRGHLGSARSTWLWDDDGQMLSVPIVPVNDLAHGVLMAWQEGLVLLVQRRVAPGTCEYIAVKRRGVKR